MTQPTRSLARPATASSPLRLSLTQLACATAVSVGVAFALLQDGPLSGVWQAYVFPSLGALYAAAGLIAWQRRPANRLGALLLAAGAAVLLSSLANTSVRPLIAVGQISATLPLSVIVHLALAAPSGHVRGRVARWIVVAAYFVGLVLEVPVWAYAPEPPPFDVLEVSAKPNRAIDGLHAQHIVGAVVILVASVLLVRRVREYDASRRVELVLLLGYPLLAVAFIPVSGDFLGSLGNNAVALQAGILAIVPIGYLTVMLRGGFARTGELSSFVESISSTGGSRRDLEKAVAGTLGDSTAAVLRWSPTQRKYLDSADREVEPELVGAYRQVVELSVADQPVGALVYDTQLGVDPQAVVAVGQVIAIALDRDRLTRELTTNQKALREASLRVLTAGDDERRRIARDLHDGAQGALVRLSIQARQLSESAGPDGARAAETLADELDTAAHALRNFVDGVMPALLVERGLAAAVEELVVSLPIRARLQAGELTGRLPAPVETTAYFVVSEALTNVVKHAAASTAQIRLDLRDDVLEVEVTDDGRGGAVDRAERSGSGLTGLEDRLAVLGGTLSVSSGESGTRLRARLPCG